MINIEQFGTTLRAQELCESRDSHPEVPVPHSPNCLMVSEDVKQH